MNITIAVQRFRHGSRSRLQCLLSTRCPHPSTNSSKKIIRWTAWYFFKRDLFFILFERLRCTRLSVCDTHLYRDVRSYTVRVLSGVWSLTPTKNTLLRTPHLIIYDKKNLFFTSSMTRKMYVLIQGWGVVLVDVRRVDPSRDFGHWRSPTKKHTFILSNRCLISVVDFFR